MIDLIYNKKFCLNKYQPSIRFNGIQLETFFAPAEKGRGAESFVKLFQVLADFNKKKSSSGKAFFISRKRIKEILNTKRVGNKITGYGNTYCDRTFQRMESWLAELEIITIERNTKAEIIASDEEKHRRELKINQELLDRLLSVYDPEDPFLKDHAYTVALKQVMKLVNDKKIPQGSEEEIVIKKAGLYLSRLKKIILKRPMSDVGHAKEKYLEYERLGLSKGKYRNENEMFVYYIYHMTGRYYDVSKFFEKNIPTYLQDIQKVTDDAYLPNVVPILKRKDLEVISMAGLKEKGNLIRSRYGYIVPPELLRQAREACISYDNSSHIIRGHDILAEMGKVVNKVE